MVRKLSVEEVARRRTLLFGVLAVIFGILIFRNGVGFTKFSLDLLAIYFLVDGLGSFLLRFLLRSKSNVITIFKLFSCRSNNHIFQCLRNIMILSQD